MVKIMMRKKESELEKKTIEIRFCTNCTKPTNCCPCLEEVQEIRILVLPISNLIEWCKQQKILLWKKINNKKSPEFRQAQNETLCYLIKELRLIQEEKRTGKNE